MNDRIDTTDVSNDGNTLYTLQCAFVSKPMMSVKKNGHAYIWQEQHNIKRQH